MNTYTILFLVLALLNLVGFFWLTVVAFQRSMLWGVAVLLFSPISAIAFALTNWFNAGKAFLIYMISFLLFSGTVVYFLAQIGLGNIQQISLQMQQGKLRPAQAYQLMTQALHGAEVDFSGNTEQLAADTGKANPAAAQVPSSEPQQPAMDKAIPAASAAGKAPAQPMEAPMPATMEELAATEQATPVAPQTTKPVAARQDDVKKPSVAPKEVKQAPRQNPVPDFKNVEPDPLAQKKLNLPPKTVVVSMSRVHHYIGHYFIIKLKNGNERRGLLVKVESSRLILDRKLYGGNLKYRLRKHEIKSLHMLRNPPKER